MKTNFQIISPQSNHGESPVWDYKNNILYWVDILEGKFIETKLSTGAFQVFNVDQPLGVLVPTQNKSLILALRDGFAEWDIEKKKIVWMEKVEYENKNSRFNDGAVDVKGRFFAGTTHFDCNKPIGNLYSLGEERNLKLHQSELICSNGMGWSSNNKNFYLIDTGRHVLYEYDFDLATGKIFNQKIKISFDENQFPDGMAIDADNCFWIAMWGDGKIVRYDQEGTFMSEIKLPVPHVTSCCFAGKDLNILIVTTSQLLLNKSDLLNYPEAGKTFLIESPTQGKRQNYFMF